MRAALVASTLLALVAGGCGRDGRDGDAAPAPAGQAEGAEEPVVDDDGADGGDGDSPVAPPAGAPAAAPAPGFDGDAVTVAIVAPLADDGAAVTGAVTAGQHAYWRYVNERLGGVGARYAVEVRTVDARGGGTAAYDRHRDEVVLLAHAGEEALNGGVRARLHRDGVVAVPGSRSARWSADRHLLPVGVPEPDQIAFAQAWLEDQGRTAGPECVVAAVAELAERIAAAPPASGCAAVVLRGAYPATEAVLEAAAAADAPTEWILLADGWAAPLAEGRLQRYVERQVSVVQEVTCAPGCEPDRGASGADLADPWFRYGWAEARVAHHVLEEALEAGGLDRDTVRAAAASSSGVDLDGVLPAWEYESRRAPAALAMYEVDAERPGALAPVS